MSEYFNQFFCDFNNRFSVIIEDDGKVAYGYLMDDEDIVGDVWLYNQKPSPQESLNWKSKDDLPFLHSLEYIKENILPIKDDEDIRCEWAMAGNRKTLKEVEIFIRDRFIAKLAINAFPGWSTMVIKDSRLAKQT